MRYESIDLGINFTATYNCNKQATELYYSENGIVQPGILTGQQTLTSPEVQYTYTFNTEDTSLSETNLNNGQMYILGKQGNSLTWNQTIISLEFTRRNCLWRLWFEKFFR